MNQEQIDSMQGQLLALSSTITQLIMVLPELPAARAALGLAIEQEEQNELDAQNDTPNAESRARNAVLSGYVELLQAVSENG